MATVVLESLAISPARPAADTALDELDRVYGFVFSRVGNRLDAEDLTQQVALKALPKLRDGAHPGEIRAYLFATARSVLATFWEGRSHMRELELPDDLSAPGLGAELAPPVHASEAVATILARLQPNHRRLLELRFLRGYTLSETAAEMGKTVGSVKVMQLRALRHAASVIDPEPHDFPNHAA